MERFGGPSRDSLIELEEWEKIRDGKGKGKKLDGADQRENR